MSVMFPLVRPKNDHSSTVFACDSCSSKEAAKAVYFIEFYVGIVPAREIHIVPVECLPRRAMSDIEAHGNTKQRFGDKFFGVVLKNSWVPLLQDYFEEFIN